MATDQRGVRRPQGRLCDIGAVRFLDADSLNAALNGLAFTPTKDFTGQATLTIVANDLGNTGSGGP